MRIVLSGVVPGMNTQLIDENAHDRYQQARGLLAERRPIEAAQIAAPLESFTDLPESFLEVLAQAYFASAQLGRAERVLRRLVEQAPVNPWAHRALARTLERRGARDEAARYHRMANAFGAPTGAELSDQGVSPVSLP